MAVTSSALVAAIFTVALSTQESPDFGFRPWRVLGAMVLFDLLLYCLWDQPFGTYAHPF